VTEPRPGTIEAAYIDACRGELQSLKPGNVHVFAGGHDMDVALFERSAVVSAPHIAKAGAGLGERIEAATLASLDSAKCNTNLGIILLCAPLAAGAQAGGGPLRVALSRVLDATTVEDTRAAYRAIAAANPAGLGAAPAGDVHAAAPAITLTQAMTLARDRDRIAAAYANDFEEVFGFALPALTAARLSASTPERAVTALHMALLAEFPDSHIARKYGLKTAEKVQDEAHELRASFIPAVDDGGIERLLAFDASLKARGLNPGTTADFVVAALFAEALLHQLFTPKRKRVVGKGV